MLDRHPQSGYRFPRLVHVTMAFAGIILGFLIARMFIISFTVSDESMSPTLTKGSLVYILKHITPGYGDIILFYSPSEPGKVLLQRVIAAEGDTVEVRNKVVYKNNEKARFPWKTISRDARIFPMSVTARDNMPGVKLDENSFFLLGDNPDCSYDSRSFGVIRKESVIGKVIYIFKR